MANLVQYAKALVFVNGSKLTEETNVSITRTSNSQPVSTVDRGYAGESPGAAMTEISVSNAVPSTDFEFDAGPILNAVGQVELSIVLSGSLDTFTVTGFIHRDNFSHAVNTASKLDFEFRGGPGVWSSSTTSALLF